MGETCELNLRTTVSVREAAAEQRSIHNMDENEIAVDHSMVSITLAIHRYATGVPANLHTSQDWQETNQCSLPARKR